MQVRCKCSECPAFNLRPSAQSLLILSAAVRGAVQGLDASDESSARRPGDTECEFFQEWDLCRIHLRPGGLKVEERRPVDLREDRTPPRLRRPFHLECVAADGGGIAIPLKAP